MGMEKVLSLLILFAIGLNLLVFIVITFFILKPDLAGFIIVEGGNYSRVNMVVYRAPSEWAFFYGNISLSAGNNITIEGGSLKPVNVNGDPYINNTWIIASTNQEINLSVIEPSDPADLDLAMGLLPIDPVSATNVFNLTRSFRIGNQTYLAWTMMTRSYDGEYIVALFNDSSGFVYIAQRVPGGVGFNNGTSDFQMMVPVSGNTTYFISTWTNESQQMNCSKTFNLTARVVGNDTVLSWDLLDGAQSYTISYIDNITNPKNVTEYLFNYSLATQVSGIINTTWIDNTSMSTAARYYTVTSISGNQECSTEESVATLKVDLLKTALSGYNFISTPLELENESILEVLDPIMDNLVRAYWYNNSNNLYSDISIFCVGSLCLTIDNIHHFRPRETYWIEVDDNVTLSIAGKVQNLTDISLSTGYNAMSFHIIEHDRQATSVFNQIFGNMTTVYEYDNDLKFYRQLSLFCVGNSCIPIGDLETVEPVVSYWVGVTQEEGITWPR